MKCLALQGGGTRGIMQCAILKALGAPDFDLIASTSVGAIVGGCYALCIKDVTKFFTDSAPKIFSGAWWIPLPRLWSSAKYSPDALRNALLGVVGNATLADCKTMFIATGFEMTTGRTTYFQSYGKSSSDGDEIIIGPDSGTMMVDVMMASSAAQSYFPGHKIGNWLFWDGGSSGFNAPDMLALTEAEQFVPTEQIEMLSLGNGNTPWPYAGSNMENPGIATVAEVTFDIAYSGPENAMVWLARHRIGGRHQRINPNIPDYAIDDASPATLAAMQAAALNTLAAGGGSENPGAPVAGQATSAPPA